MNLFSEIASARPFAIRTISRFHFISASFALQTETAFTHMNMDPVPDKFHPNSSNGAIYFLWLTSFFFK